MITDVNIHLSRWPTRRLHYDEPERLIKKLKASEVTSAWTGSFDSLLHRDIAAVNAQIADTCRSLGNDILVPVGTINPTLPDWKDDVRRCAEDHKMRAVRVYPNYHSYTLEDAPFAELFGICAKEKLVLQVAVTMEDDRTQHPMLRVPPVDVRPLKRLFMNDASATVILLNALRTLRIDELPELMSAGPLYVDISNLEGVAGIEKLLQHASHDRILFGSHFPFFNFEAASLKLRESELGGEQREAIMHRNAQRILES